MRDLKDDCCLNDTFRPACCGCGCSPTPFHSIYHLNSSYDAPSISSTTRLAKYSYLYSLVYPLPFYLVHTALPSFHHSTNQAPTPSPQPIFSSLARAADQD
jgi:hypothetical protein